MTLLIPTGFATVSYKFGHASLARPAYCTFAVDMGGLDGAQVATNCASAYGLTNSWNTRLDSQVTMTQVLVREGVGTTEGIPWIQPTSFVGARSGEAVTPNVAVLCHKRTARAGHRGSGRMFAPWVAGELDVNEVGVIAPTDLNTLQIAFETWRARLTADGNRLVLLHAESDADVENPSEPGPPDVVTSVQVDRLISTQRRRLPRG